VTIPPELWILPPVAIAAGIDLYLTLLVLGAAPTTGLWEQPMPGALSDLDSPSVMIVVGVFYLLEFAAERYPPSALVWNAFHAVIRPVSGMLLALLLLSDQPSQVVVLGSICTGLLTSLAHAARSGGAVIRWLSAATAPHVLLVSLLEDVIVLGILVLALDLPAWAFGAALAGMVLVSARVGSDLRAFAFAVRLAVDRLFHTLDTRRWLGPDELPAWVLAALDGDDGVAAGGALRGSQVGAHRLPGSPSFVIGWVLARGGGPVLVFRRRGTIERVELDGFALRGVFERGFFRRVDLRTGSDAVGCIFFRLNGPSAASLRAEFATAG
jgi:hypothetical protein